VPQHNLQMHVHQLVQLPLSLLPAGSTLTDGGAPHIG
jgi:hypothetical protein